MKILIFGTGDIYQKNKYKIYKIHEIVGFIDNDQAKQHTTIEGINVYAPDEVVLLDYEKIILMSTYAEDMREQLITIGINENVVLDYLDAYEFIEFPQDQYYGNIERLNGTYTIVFSHSLTSTGAQNALFNLVKVLKENDESIILVSANDGIQKEWYRELNIPVIVSTNINEGNDILVDILSKASKIIINTLWMYHAVKLCVSKECEIFWWIHETSTLHDISKNTFRKIANHSNCRIISASHLIDENLHKLYGNDIEISRLYFGINDYTSEQEMLSSRIDRNQKVVFACIGGISYIKGQDLFIAAISSLPKEKKKRAKFLIIGSGNLSIEDEEIVRNDDSIDYAGEIDNKKMQDVYSELDVIVCCSRKESMSVVVAEACMNSKLSIVSNVAGIVQLLQDGYNALIFENENVEALSSKLLWVLDHYDEAISIGKRSRKVYQDNFTMDIFRDNVIKVGMV